MPPGQIPTPPPGLRRRRVFGCCYTCPLPCTRTRIVRQRTMNNQNQQPPVNLSDPHLQARLALLAAQQQGLADRQPVSQDHIAAMAAAMGSMQGQNRDAIMKQASYFSHRPRPPLTSHSYKRSRTHKPTAQSSRLNRQPTSSRSPDLAPHRLQTSRVYLHHRRLPHPPPPTPSIKIAFNIRACPDLAQAIIF